jgi:hypothetical protein
MIQLVDLNGVDNIGTSSVHSSHLLLLDHSLLKISGPNVESHTFQAKTAESIIINLAAL